MKKMPLLSSALLLVILGGCVTEPDSPTVQVKPGRGKSFSDFQRDDFDCRSFASDRVAGRAESANDRAILTTIVGAGLGAALGGAIGGGSGAGIGAAAGGVAGTAVGANRSNDTQANLQYRFDLACAQCMASKGNDVPWLGPRSSWGGSPPPPRF